MRQWGQVPRLVFHYGKMSRGTCPLDLSFQHISAMVYRSFSDSSHPRQGSVMDFPYT